jgi:hypothetical protein
MAMTARDFVEQINAIKASVKSGECTPQIEADLDRLKDRLRTSLTPEELKAALASNAEIPTGLEEDLTTLTMAWMHHRGSAS